MKPDPANLTQSKPGEHRAGSMEELTALSSLRKEVNACLDRLISAHSIYPTNLHKVMRYSLLNGGKRARGILCILVSQAAGCRDSLFALQTACAIEMVHTASLILDDLPSMDSANIRRGQPTAHKKFGVASSILASIGLLNRAYEVIAQCPSANEQMRCDAILALTKAVGKDGMIAGQDIDLHARGAFADIAQVEHLNWLKTGVLFCAAAEIGAIGAGLDVKSVDAVRRFATHVGLAFQTADDLIDQHGTLEAAGKDVCKDALKPTLVSLAGTNDARNACREHLDLAGDALLQSGLDGTMLNVFVDSIFVDLIKN